MRRLFFALAACAVVFASCKKETEIIEEPTPPAYEFVNQNLKGKINGTDWSMSGGVVSQYPDSSYFFSAFESTTTDYCEYVSNPPAENNVYWFMDELKVGLYEFNASGSTQSATFNHKEGAGDFAFFDSAIEILTIDTAAGIVTGRVALKGQQTADNVNGNFSFTYCK